MINYVSLKYLHVACAFVSIALFIYRFLYLYRNPTRTLGRTLKALPHFVDTILLSAGAGMLWLLGLNPFDANWLLVKLAALLAYILLGAFCLRSKAGSGRQLLFFVLALVSVSYIVIVAIGKTPVPN